MIGGLTLWKMWKSSALAACGSLQERSCILPKRFFLTLLVLLAVSGASLAQTVKALRHQPPDGIQLTFQLTDGTVLAQGNGASDWWKLTPDNTGSYVNGIWTQVASLPAGYVPDDSLLRSCPTGDW